MLRSELALLLADLVGGELEIHDAADGWPARGAVSVGGATLPVALFVGPVGLSQRQRDHRERRFQNPAANPSQKALGATGRPLNVPDGHLPLLLGLWIDDEIESVNNPVLVLGDAWKRAAVATRHSVFIRLDALRVATVTGWSYSFNDDGERMTLFHPVLLPAVALAQVEGVIVPELEAGIAISASGLVAVAVTDEVVLDPGERARRSVTSIVRAAQFARKVVSAYAGLCALCGLDLGLVQGAHIYPASAPGSPDTVWNGICLCSNHHAAFDQHLIWVDPDEKAVVLNPTVLDQVDGSPAAAAFVASTSVSLHPPVERSAAPKPEMFERRYKHFEGLYDWIA